MSHNSSDHEAFSTHLRRFITRQYKCILRLPMILDDISVIRLPKVHDTVYEARRNGTNGWSVYRFYKVSYDKKKQIVHEKMYVDLTVAEVLDTLYHLDPDAIAHPQSAYHHPVQVARMIGHVFGSTD